MYRFVKSSDDIMAMSKINEEDADFSRIGKFKDWLMFGYTTKRHGPRIKFPGGTRETDKSRNAPFFEYGKDGEVTIDKSKFPKEKYPNVHDDDILLQYKSAILSAKPLFLLSWYERIDSDFLRRYLEGKKSWEDLIMSMDIGRTSATYDELIELNSLDDLDAYARKTGLYSF